MKRVLYTRYFRRFFPFFCRFVDVFSSLEQPAKMVLYNLASNPYDQPTVLQELHSAMDERVMALRHKLAPPEV